MLTPVPEIGIAAWLSAPAEKDSRQSDWSVTYLREIKMMGKLTHSGRCYAEILVEVAGIEPASKKDQTSVLHV